MGFLGSFSDSKSPHASSILLGITADLSSDVIWTVSILPVISKSSSPSTKPVVTVPIDSAAKSALDLTPDKSRIPYTDLKPTINKFLHTKWQQQWSNNIHNKLFQIQPTLGEWRSASRKSRREQVVISRLRIGHTRLTHSFILKQEPQPQF